MVGYAIRRAAACAEDAAALAAIEAATLGDSDLTVAEMLAVLDQPNQYVYLAHAAGLCIGMLATFETPSRDGTRLELDMLGVAQRWRGKGLARAMVLQAMADGRRRGCATFRAVVATGNPASRRVFERCGLSASAPCCQLLTRVLPGHAPTSVLPDGWSSEWFADLSVGLRGVEDTSWCLRGHEGLGVLDERGVRVALLALLRVNTVAYAGYWVEKARSVSADADRVALLVAAEHAKSARLDEVGILVQVGDRLSSAAMEAGYDLIGDYYYMVN